MSSAKKILAAYANGQRVFTEVDPYSDLRGADLREASFAGAVLVAADLRDADLREVVFARTSLVGADLRGANLANASFADATIMSWWLPIDGREGRIDRSALESQFGRKPVFRTLQGDEWGVRQAMLGANFHGADFTRSPMTGNFSGADLRGATHDYWSIQHLGAGQLQGGAGWTSSMAGARMGRELAARLLELGRDLGGVRIG